MFLAHVSHAAADRGTTTELRLFDDGEHVTVNAETFDFDVILCC